MENKKEILKIDGVNYQVFLSDDEFVKEFTRHNDTVFLVTNKKVYSRLKNNF